MTTEQKINFIYKSCKASFCIHFNNHKDYYQTIDQYVSDFSDGNEMNRVDVDVWNEMILKDTLVELTFYPNTPIGSYTIRHYDLNAALDASIKLLIEEEGRAFTN